MKATLTILTSQVPTILSKSIRRNLDGGIDRVGGGPLVEGHAQIATVTSLQELKLLLEGLGPSQALTFGIPRGGTQRILSRRALTRQTSTDGITTRTRDQFAWPDGPGILMLDHDPDETPITRDELVGMIRTAAPVLSPSRITLENNGKIRPQPDRENAFAGASGGYDGPHIQPSPV